MLSCIVRRFVVFLLLLMTAGLWIQAQDTQIHALTFTTVANQPTSIVIDLMQDSRGFIWMSTMSGLYRYDGYEFRRFSYDPADTTTMPPVSMIFDMMEDRQGMIWIATYDNLLIRYDRATETFRKYTVTPEYPKTYPQTWIDVLYEDRSGTLWAGSPRGGLKKFNKTNGTFTTYRQEPDNLNSMTDYIVAIHEDLSGNFWVATMNGVFLFDRQKEEFTRFRPSGTVPGGWDDVSISNFCDDEDGVVWFGTGLDLFKYNPTDNTLVRYDYPGRILINPLGNNETLWLCSTNAVYMFNKNTGTSIPYTFEFRRPNGNRCKIILITYDMIIDRSGRLWMATDDLGLLTADMIISPFENYHVYKTKVGGQEYSPISFFIDRGSHLWVGTNEGAVILFDENMNRLKSWEELHTDLNPFGNDVIYSISDDRDDNVWISHYNRGIFSYDKKHDRFINYPLTHPLANLPVWRIRDIMEDHEGIIWAVSGVGVYYRDKRSPQDTKFQVVDDSTLSVSDTWCLCEDYEGSVWFGTQGQGLFRLTPDHRNPMTFEQYLHHTEDPHSLCSDVIRSLHVTASGELWIGTNNGLNKYNKESSSFEMFHRENGLDADMIYSIEEDGQENLWLLTDQGLARFNPQAVQGSKFKVFHVQDGLPFDKLFPYNLFKCRDGKLYIGGRRNTGDGFLRFNPDSLRANSVIPPVVLTGFHVRNEVKRLDSSISEIRHIRLRYNENYFSFDFAALDYRDPPANQYAYLLQGLDGDWIYSGNRRYASYTAVPPGNYVFRVKGSNNDGKWNEQGVAVRVSILPPPWKTWWAYTLYVIIIAALIYNWRRYDLKRLRLKQQLELEHVEADKLKELDRMKSRFFANISHEFRTPLTLIMGPIEKIRETVTGEVKHDLEMMQRNARRLQNLITQLLDLSKLESGKMVLQAKEENVITLVRSYVQQFESLAKQKGIMLTFTAEKDEIKAFVDGDKIEKILYNLLSNAFKFTEGGGTVEVSVFRSSGSQVFRSAWSREPTNLQTRRPADLPTRRPQDAHEWIEISFADTGIGIPQDKLPHIFDRFYQADESYTKDGEGTGIGLALTKELVELHGGVIEVESEVGIGSIFRVYLPVGSEISKSEKREAKSEMHLLGIEEQTSKVEYRTSTIDKPQDHLTPWPPLLLIVEDNADLRLYIRGFLEQDYEVIEAQDGEQGLARAIEYIPDLVLTDVMMPKMDGYELSRKLKGDERTSHIPVILLTARASMESKIEGLETGADDFLTKPFDPPELMVRIKNLILQRRRLKDRYLKASGAGLFVVTETGAGELLSVDEQFLRKVKKTVEKHLADSTFSVDTFASEMNLSRVQLHRKLKALIDLPASDYIRTLRLNKAAELIAHKTANIASIAYDVGFTNPSHFSEAFRKQFGVVPSKYQSQKS
jgi:signal transduction histidine kinase/ligand-binding sensor domain-containing protein/DNA-binding response OmpR family regulator